MSDMHKQCNNIIDSVRKKNLGYVKYAPPVNSKAKKYVVYRGWALKSGKMVDEVYIAFTPSANFKKYLQSWGLKWKVSKMGWLVPKQKMNDLLKVIERECPGWERVVHFDGIKKNFEKHPLLGYPEVFLE